MIQAKVIADSLSPSGDRLTTLEVVMPRYILAEFNTHRILSKNSASSRAIPFNKMVQSVQNNVFIPYAWQKDHKGMQGNEYFTDKRDIDFLISNHLYGKDIAIQIATHEHEHGSTKQNANRKLEPYMYHKVLVSGTEWENFFNLRCPMYESTDSKETKYFKSRKDWCSYHTGHGIKPEDWTIVEWLKINKGQADIHMMFLAEAVWDAMNESVPKELKEGEWHIPYSVDVRDENQVKQFSDLKRKNLVKDGLEAQCKISVARCARLSYQTLGDNPEINYEKDLELYEVLSKSGHWSPFEHVAKVMTGDEYLEWNKGKLEWSEDKLGYNIIEETIGWCRNFRGFIQYRELLDN
jgi:thymidylate synthase ThyX